jgi:putative ABC transport system substrate-binding protein
MPTYRAVASRHPLGASLKRETRTIPIVFAGVGDPVASGLVPRLNQPGGNITGFAIFETSLSGKWLELLSEIAPGLKRATRPPHRLICPKQAAENRTELP